MQIVGKTNEKHEFDNILIRNEFGELEEAWSRKEGFVNIALFDETMKKLDDEQRAYILWFVE